MITLKESLIGNVKRAGLSDGSNLKKVKDTLDSPEVITPLVKQCFVMAGSQNDTKLVPEIIIDKRDKSIRFFFPDLKKVFLQFELDWDKWESFKLPKKIVISSYKKAIRLYTPATVLGIIRSKKGIVEGLDIQVGKNILGLYFENGLIFKNCTFRNYTEFNILREVDFDIKGQYIKFINRNNIIYNQLTGSYQENNIGFTWNHLKPVEMFYNCNFDNNAVFPLYYKYNKGQETGTNFFTINNILTDIVAPDMFDFKFFSKDFHFSEIRSIE